MFVQEGDAADLEADATRVGLEAVFLQMSAGVAQLTDADQRAVFDFVPFSLAPEAFVTELLIGPVPGTVDGGLDTTDVSGIEGGCGRCKVMGDVTA